MATKEDLLIALEKAQQTIIENIGIGEEEKVQEKGSSHEFKNIQEQLKRDIIWLTQELNKTENQYELGNINSRIYRKHKLDYEL